MTFIVFKSFFCFCFFKVHCNLFFFFFFFFFCTFYLNNKKCKKKGLQCTLNPPPQKKTDLKTILKTFLYFILEKK